MCDGQDAVDRGWLLSEASHFSGVLGLKRLLLTALELAKALAYLHGLDIMHGDLTGGNVMLHSAPVTSADPRGFVVKVGCYVCYVTHDVDIGSFIATLPCTPCMSDAAATA